MITEDSVNAVDKEVERFVRLVIHNFNFSIGSTLLQMMRRKKQLDWLFLQAADTYDLGMQKLVIINV